MVNCYKPLTKLRGQFRLFVIGNRQARHAQCAPLTWKKKGTGSQNPLQLVSDLWLTKVPRANGKWLTAPPFILKQNQMALAMNRKTSQADFLLLNWQSWYISNLRLKEVRSATKCCRVSSLPQRNALVQGFRQLGPPPGYHSSQGSSRLVQFPHLQVPHLGCVT